MNGERFQLRCYRIDPADLDRFLTVWRERVVPLRASFGLRTGQAWVSADRDRFVWVSFVDDGRDHAQVEADYLASHERRTLTPDPAQWVREADVFMVVPEPGDRS